MFWPIIAIFVASAASHAAEVKYEQVTGAVEHGEGPHWSDEHQALYWVDISQGDVWRYHPVSGSVTTCHLGGEVTVVVPVKGRKDSFTVGIGTELKLLEWDGRNGSTTVLRPLADFAPQPKGARLNDGKVDCNGRMWVGTIGAEIDEQVEANVANLYRVICNGGKLPEVTTVVENVTVSNGIAWTADGAIMYYVDSPTRNIDAFDFDAVNGTISNRRTIFDLNKHNISGVPDGMTIDADDNLWIAIYNGAMVIEVNPHLGHLVATFPIEGAIRVTSTSWGGASLDDLYVTTSSRGGGGGKEAGRLYRLRGTGARGRPAHDFSLDACKMK